MSKIIKLDTEVVKDFIAHMVEGDDHLYFDADSDTDIDGLTKIANGTFQYIGKVLGEAKSQDEETVLQIPGEVEFTVTYREGTGGNGNFGIGARALEGLVERSGATLDEE